jgi:hypothetical protein
MPKSVPIITDWPASQRLEIVRGWHPGYEVSEAPNQAKAYKGASEDQEAWYACVKDGNHYQYRLTVEELLKENIAPRFS